MDEVKYVELNKIFDPDSEYKLNFHFYASSVATWRTNQNVEELIKDMKAEGYPFRLWYVPLPDDAEYDIQWYAPKVEDAVAIAYYATAEDNAYA